MSEASRKLGLPRLFYSSLRAVRVARWTEQQRRWAHKPAPRARSRPQTRPPSPRARQRVASSAPKWQDGSSHGNRMRKDKVEDATQQFYQGEQQRQSRQPQQASPQPQQPGLNTQLATTLANSDKSDLVADVHMPDDPEGVLPPDHPALSLLGNSSLVIQRQIEMMNLIIGFEQANRYVIMDGQGETIGYIAERDHGIGSSLARNMFKTHRSFTTHIFDRQEREVLRIHRPFAFINSRIRIYDPVPEGGYKDTDTSTALQGTSAGSAINQGSVAQTSPLKLEQMRIIGEAQQQWALLRRKYNLFTYRPLVREVEDSSTARLESGDKSAIDSMALTEAETPERAVEAGMAQFAHVDEPFLSWDFRLRNEQDEQVASVNRNFGGFAREIFTDTGVYVLRMDSAVSEADSETSDTVSMTRDQRAVMLATAISIDFDYFSRHSGRSGFMPMWLPFGGGGAAAEGAGAGAAGVGAIEGAGVGAVGAAGRGVAGGAASEGAIASAGTMAGYEAMQRGVYGGGQQPEIPPQERVVDEASPQNSEPMFDPDNQGDPAQGQTPSQDDNWNGSGDDDPWGRSGGDDPPPPSAGGEGGGGGGEGGGSWLDDLF